MNSSSSIFMMYFISHLRCGRRVAGAVKTTLGIYLFFFNKEIVQKDHEIM